MRILVTGASGFVGRILIRLLAKEKHTVLAHACSRMPNVQGKRIEVVRSDVCDIGEVAQGNIDVVIHLAAAGVARRSDDYHELFRVNVQGSLEVLKLAELKSARVIVAGSFAEYGLSADYHTKIPTNAELIPTYAYGASKAAQAALCRDFASRSGISLRYLRLFNVFGEGLEKSYLWESLRLAARSGREVRLSPGEQIRDFVHVSSVVAVIKHLIDENPVGCEVFNVGSGYELTIRQFSEYWWRHWGGEPDLLKFGAIGYRANEPMRYTPMLDGNIVRIVRQGYDYAWCREILRKDHCNPRAKASRRD